MVFYRDYQTHAIDEIVHAFNSLERAPRRRSVNIKQNEVEKSDAAPGHDRGDPESDQSALSSRIIIVVAPTAAGKSLTMAGVAAKLSELGFATLALSYSDTVAKQNRRNGLLSSTIQGLFAAIEMAREHKLRGRKILSFAAERLSLPSSFFEKEIAILVDEAHLGLENCAALYSKTLSSISNARIVVGFTATPRWTGWYRQIDLTPFTEAHVAKPMGSIIHTQSLLTLHNQISLFPAPSLVFCRSVMSASLLNLVFRINFGPDSSALIVGGDGRGAVASFLERFFRHMRDSALSSKESAKPEAAEAGDEEDQEKREGVGDVVEGVAARFFRHLDFSDEFSHASANFGVSSVDPMERRLGLIALFWTLSQAVKRGDAYARCALALHGAGVPRFPEAFKMVREAVSPKLYRDFRELVLGRIAGEKAFETTVRRVCDDVISSPALPGISPERYVAGGYAYGFSVLKISAGFDLPRLRTIISAESVVSSRVLYKQRAGRGSRRINGKDFYDIVDVVYGDPMSDGTPPNKRVTWVNTFVKDLKSVQSINQSDLVVRVPCD